MKKHYTIKFSIEPRFKTDRRIAFGELDFNFEHLPEEIPDRFGNYNDLEKEIWNYIKALEAIGEKPLPSVKFPDELKRP